MKNEYSKELIAAKKIALQAGKIMLRYFDADQEVKMKSDNSVVTIADTLINELVIAELNKKFPEDGIIGEERSTCEYGGGRKWFCDPIDGTNAFVWGTPTAMFSLALVIDGKPVVGVAYDPFLKKMYYGVKGEGSFCNKTELKVSDIGFAEGIVAITSSARKIPKLAYLDSLMEEKARLAAYSGAVHKACLVARGKFIAYIEEGVNPHDMAAVHVIVEEAGGAITGMKGEKLDYKVCFKGAVVSNAIVHEKLLSIIKSE
jgi:histidinol-phosphatase